MNARVQQLFHDVVDLSPDARVRYFVEHGVDEETRRQVEGLLVFDAVPTTPLERDIGMVASRTLAQLEAISGRCGSYQLLRLIGRGGMGVVYVAQRNDGEVSQQAAVKLLRFGVDSHQARQRFLRERQILANLSHPNIARLLDAGHREDGQPYLVMEYIDGKPIDDYCESLPVRRKVELLVPICEAVSYAHHHLVVHRDLKPGNVLVSPDGIPRLLDFGIAKLMDATGDATVTADRQLTPIYASPEQVRGESVGPATDIYSLGAILFKLLTGRGPFQLASEMTRAELEAAICKTQLIKPSRIQPKVDRDLDAIVLKAMRKEPSERYATVEQLAGDLKAWLQQRPVAARKGERWYLAKRYIRTRWVPLAAAGLALAGLVAGLVLARHQRPRVPEHFEFIRTTRLTSSGQSMKAAISPNGRYIAHTLLTPGMESLQVRQAANLHDVELVPPTAVRYLGITFSPDSETVYYVARAAGTSQPPVLYRVPARGGSPQKLLQGLDSPPTFSPDGKRLAFVRESAGESTLMVVDIDSGAEQRLVSRKLPLVLDYPAC